MFNKVVSLFLVTVIGLSCVGCGVKVEQDITTPQDIKTTQSTQLPDLETHDVDSETQETTESTESEETTMLDTTDIKNACICDAEIIEWDYVRGRAKLRSRVWDTEFYVDYKYTNSEVKESDSLSIDNLFATILNKNKTK